LCLTGEVAWARLSAPVGDLTQLIGATPIALFLREHAERWACLPFDSAQSRPFDFAQGRPFDSAQGRPGGGPHRDISEDSRRVLEVLRARGASFAHDLAITTGLEAAVIRDVLGELVAAGLIASDGFGGLRSIVRSAGGRRLEPAGRSSIAGRWSLTRSAEDWAPTAHETAVEAQARVLLLRYGVVFRKLLAREPNSAPWRELTRVYRRLEARGEIRGGRFVAGMSGEQFALPDAVERLREIRRTSPDDRVIAVSAADPLNLAGIVTTGDRVRAVTANRVAYRNGVPLAALEGDFIHPLTQTDEVAAQLAAEIATTLTGRQMPAVLSGFVGR